MGEKAALNAGRFTMEKYLDKLMRLYRRIREEKAADVDVNSQMKCRKNQDN
jgi:hypothetical protein